MHAQSVNSHGLQSVFHPTKEFLFCSFSQANNGSKYLSSGLTSIFLAPTTFSSARVQGSDFPRRSILLQEKRQRPGHFKAAGHTFALYTSFLGIGCVFFGWIRKIRHII